MAVVKSEPHAEPLKAPPIDLLNSKDQCLQTPQNHQTGTKQSSLKIPNSRPKIISQNKNIKDDNNDKKVVNKPKVNFSDYLLSPTNLYNDDFKDDSISKFNFFGGNNNMSTENRSSPVVKSEPIERSMFAFTDINKKVGNVTETSDHSKEKKQKRSKLETNNNSGKLKKTKIPQMTNKLNSNKEVVDGTNEIIPKNPGIFNPVKGMLYDRQKIGVGEEEKLFKDLFEDADPNEELDYCKEVVQYPLEKWLECGQDFTKEHEILIKDLMKTRLELSYKFEVITKTMNDRCEALVKQEDHLDGKLKQIKDIANNMLNIL